MARSIAAIAAVFLVLGAVPAQGRPVSRSARSSTSTSGAVVAKRTHTLHQSGNSISCVSTTVCLVVGSRGHHHAAIAEIVNGKPKKYRKVPGLTALSAISCPAPTSPCEATGSTSSGYAGVVISKTGVPRKTFTLPALFTAISCHKTSAACEAVAYNGSSVLLISIKHGRHGRLHTLSAPVGDSSAISCGSASRCEVVGAYMMFAPEVGARVAKGFVVPVRKGKPGHLVTVTQRYGLHGIACPKPKRCVVAEVGAPRSDVLPRVATLTGHTFTRIHRVSKASLLTAVACSSPVRCAAVGSNPTATVATVVRISHGRPDAEVPVRGASYLIGVACAARSVCEAVGAKKHRHKIVPDVAAFRWSK